MPAPTDAIAQFLRDEDLPAAYGLTIQNVIEPLAEQLHALAKGRHGPPVAGVCGAQGSGKSTFCEVVARLLRQRGLRVAVLSLDDLYLSRTMRADMARRIHPLFATRGPPGSHDVSLGLRTLAALRQGGEVALPRFDKATDDPAPTATWPLVQSPVDLILFEGWCVGATAQTNEALQTPVNRLEAEEDSTGVWRRFVNDALAGPYQALFSQIDHLTFLRAPAFEVVAGWRAEQEEKLRARLRGQGADLGRTMDRAQVLAFVQLYERQTRHILDTMPAMADQVIDVAPDRSMRLLGRPAQAH